MTEIWLREAKSLPEGLCQHPSNGYLRDVKRQKRKGKKRKREVAEERQRERERDTPERQRHRDREYQIVNLVNYTFLMEFPGPRYTYFHNLEIHAKD